MTSQKNQKPQSSTDASGTTSKRKSPAIVSPAPLLSSHAPSAVSHGAEASATTAAASSSNEPPTRRRRLTQATASVPLPDAVSFCLRSSAKLADIRDRLVRLNLNSSLLEELFRRVERIVSQLAGATVRLVFVGTAGVGKSEIINRLICTDPESDGRLPLPSRLGGRSVTSHITEVHRCAENQPAHVLLRYCTKEQFAIRCPGGSYEALRRYDLLRDAAPASSEAESAVQTVRRVEHLLAELPKMLSRDEQLSLDVVEVHVPAEFPKGFVLVDTPGFNHHAQDDPARRLHELRLKQAYADAAAVVCVGARVVSVHELKPLFEGGVCDTIDHVPVLVAAYLPGADEADATKQSSDFLEDFRRHIEDAVQQLPNHQKLWPAADPYHRARLFEQLLCRTALLLRGVDTLPPHSARFFTRVQYAVQVQKMAELYQFAVTFLVAAKHRITPRLQSTGKAINSIALHGVKALQSSWSTAQLAERMAHVVQERVGMLFAGSLQISAERVRGFFQSVVALFVHELQDYSCTVIDALDRVAEANYKERVLKGGTEKYASNFEEPVNGEDSLSAPMRDDEEEADLWHLLRLARTDFVAKLEERLDPAKLLPQLEPAVAAVCMQLSSAPESEEQEDVETGVSELLLQALEKHIMVPLSTVAHDSVLEEANRMATKLQDLHSPSPNDARNSPHGEKQLQKQIRELNADFNRIFDGMYRSLHEGSYRPPFRRLKESNPVAANACQPLTSDDVVAQLKKAVSNSLPRRSLRHPLQQQQQLPVVQHSIELRQSPDGNGDEWKLMRASWTAGSGFGMSIQVPARAKACIDAYMARIGDENNAKEKALVPIFQLSLYNAEGPKLTDLLKHEHEPSKLPHLVIWVVQPSQAARHLEAASQCASSNTLLLVLPENDLKPGLWLHLIKCFADMQGFVFYWLLPDNLLEAAELYRELLRTRKCSVPRALWFGQQVLLPLTVQLRKRVCDFLKPERLPEIYESLYTSVPEEDRKRGLQLIKEASSPQQVKPGLIVDLIAWLDAATAKQQQQQRQRQQAPLKELAEELRDAIRPLRELACLTFPPAMWIVHAVVAPNSSDMCQILSPASKKPGTSPFAEVVLLSSFACRRVSFLAPTDTRSSLLSATPLTREQLRTGLKQAMAGFANDLHKAGCMGVKMITFGWRPQKQ